MRIQRLLIDSLLCTAMLFLVSVPGCSPQSATPSASPAGTVVDAQRLTLYNWVDYMPPAALENFRQEYGIEVVYKTYESMDEAVANVLNGLEYDVAIIESHRIPDLVEAGRLDEIDYRSVTNFKNISVNFRDLAYDPGNRYAVPLNWGTLGLLVRADLAHRPVTRWSDLWNEEYRGRIAIRSQPRELIAVALKSLGYSINSEDPAQLEQALQRLLLLKSSALFVDTSTGLAVPEFLTSGAVIMIGWSGDALEARKKNPAIEYVLPEEGSMVWGDNLVISSASQQKMQAALFINYLLRPEVAASFVNEYYYATANEAAFTHIEPQILNNPIVFPSNQAVSSAEWWMPLSPQGNQLWDDTWQRFLDAKP